jgi:hypothetical protein
MDAPGALELIQAGKIRVREMITRQLGLAEKAWDSSLSPRIESP